MPDPTVGLSVWRRRLHAVVEAISTGGVSLLVEKPDRDGQDVEAAARALLEEMDRLTWGVPPGVDERKDLVWFSGPVWAETRRRAEALRKAGEARYCMHCGARLRTLMARFCSASCETAWRLRGGRS